MLKKKLPSSGFKQPAAAAPLATQNSQSTVNTVNEIETTLAATTLVVQEEQTVTDLQPPVEKLPAEQITTDLQPPVENLPLEQAPTTTTPPPPPVLLSQAAQNASTGTVTDDLLTPPPVETNTNEVAISEVKTEAPKPSNVLSQ